MDVKQYILNKQQITEEIKEEIKKYLETNDNENTMTQKLWDAAKAVLRGKFIAIQSYLKKQEKSNKQPKLTPKVIRERRTISLKQLEGVTSIQFSLVALMVSPHAVAFLCVHLHLL